MRPGSGVRPEESAAATGRADQGDPAGALAGALDVLPPDDRAALLLVSLEGFTYDEAAEILRVPREVFVQRLVRARIQLAAIFDAPGMMADRSNGNRHPHLRIVK